MGQLLEVINGWTYWFSTAPALRTPLLCRPATADSKVPMKNPDSSHVPVPRPAGVLFTASRQCRPSRGLRLRPESAVVDRLELSRAGAGLVRARHELLLDKCCHWVTWLLLPKPAARLPGVSGQIGRAHV